jgi:hypothetical protein
MFVLVLIAVLVLMLVFVVVFVLVLVLVLVLVRMLVLAFGLAVAVLVLVVVVDVPVCMLVQDAVGVFVRVGVLCVRFHQRFSLESVCEVRARRRAPPRRLDDLSTRI